VRLIQRVHDPAPVTGELTAGFIELRLQNANGFRSSLAAASRPNESRVKRPYAKAVNRLESPEALAQCISVDKLSPD